MKYNICRLPKWITNSSQLIKMQMEIIDKHKNPWKILMTPDKEFDIDVNIQIKEDEHVNNDDDFNLMLENIKFFMIDDIPTEFTEYMKNNREHCAKLLKERQPESVSGMILALI